MGVRGSGLTELPLSFVEWDHNRDLMEAADADGRPAVHAQTLAVYRLLDVLRSRHPGVEIESCAPGGARVDLGILARTDRVWASDTNDALERQTIQRRTGLLLPPELIGAHVGPPRSHTTGRVHDLSFRAPGAPPSLSQRRRSRSRAIATYCTVQAARVRAWKTSWKPNQLGEGLGRFVA